jgi:hypothetical protein
LAPNPQGQGVTYVLKTPHLQKTAAPLEQKRRFWRQAQLFLALVQAAGDPFIVLWIKTAPQNWA